MGKEKRSAPQSSKGKKRECKALLPQKNRLYKLEMQKDQGRSFPIQRDKQLKGVQYIKELGKAKKRIKL